MPKTSLRKLAKDYGPTLALVLLLWATGWYRPLMAGMQRVVLELGLRRPNLDQPTAHAPLQWQFADSTGAIHSLQEFAGQTVLINFWATWCPPCRAELPDLADLSQRPEAAQVTFLMVSLDKDPEKAEAFFAEKDYPWPVYSAPFGVAPQLAAEVVPTTVVISPQGQIVMHQEGLAQYDTQKFRAFLQSLNPAPR